MDERAKRALFRLCLMGSYVFRTTPEGWLGLVVNSGIPGASHAVMSGFEEGWSHFSYLTFESADEASEAYLELMFDESEGPLVSATN